MFGLLGNLKNWDDMHTLGIMYECTNLNKLVDICTLHFDMIAIAN